MYDTETAPQLPPPFYTSTYSGRAVHSCCEITNARGNAEDEKQYLLGPICTGSFHYDSFTYRKGSNYSAKKKNNNNPRRSLALKLERKKYASVRVAPYIDRTLAL